MRTLLVAFDVDGTIDANPPVYLALMQALRTAGNRVVILSGSSGPTATLEDMEQKKTYLTSLGLDQAYDQLVVLGDPTDELKAQWLADNGADLFIDNAVKNIKAAKDICLCLCPWQTKIKDH